MLNNFTRAAINRGKRERENRLDGLITRPIGSAAPVTAGVKAGPVGVAAPVTAGVMARPVGTLTPVTGKAAPAEDRAGSRDQERAEGRQQRPARRHGTRINQLWRRNKHQS